MLQHLDLPAKRRLGHVEPRCRPAEVKFFRHGHETAKLAKIEHRCVSEIDGFP
jgi:hypothetical protein